MSPTDATDPETVVDRHRERLENHAESDRASAWVARALLDWTGATGDDTTAGTEGDQ
jgi:hypothetical protein